MNEPKEFTEFLKLIIEMCQANIDFLVVQEQQNIPELFWKYSKEICEIQDLINSFEWMK